jgi:2-dehydropantoate 2-reductase
MDVVVLGGGALGSLFAARLAAADRTVSLVDRDPEHVAAARAGLVVRGRDPVSVSVDAHTDPVAAGPADALLVCVKSYDTGAALDEATALYDETTDVCTLQNGLGNAEAIAEYAPSERVVAGTTAHGATLEGPGVVRHAGAGPTRIGRYFAPNDPRVRSLAGALADAGLGGAVTDSPRDAVWEKLLVNVGINAATALARVRNGALDTPPGRRTVRRAVNEGVRVARAEGRSVSDAAERALQVARDTADNVSSMRADVEAGRRTEVAAVNGAVVDRAERHGLPAPVNRTLADLLALASQGARGQP